MEIMAVYLEIHMEHTNKWCKQRAECFYLTAGEFQNVKTAFRKRETPRAQQQNNWIGETGDIKPWIALRISVHGEYLS
jgi:hypothetical protein